MQKLSPRKISFIELVLIAVSTVVTIIFSDKSDNDSQQFYFDSLTNDSGWGGIILSSITCAPNTYFSVQNICRASSRFAGISETSEYGATNNSTSISSVDEFGNGDGGAGQDNTSDSF